MSRYEKNLGDETIAVGWDRGLNTFFAQVFENQEEDDMRDLPVKLWLGGDFDEFTNFSSFLEKLGKSGYEIEPLLQMRLQRDQIGAETKKKSAG